MNHIDYMDYNFSTACISIHLNLIYLCRISSHYDNSLAPLREPCCRKDEKERAVLDHTSVIDPTSCNVVTMETYSDLICLMIIT